MSATAGRSDPRRAWRLVGVFAPVTVLIAVALALLSVPYTGVAVLAAEVVLPAAVAVAGWVVLRGEQTLTRVVGAFAGFIASAVAGLLVSVVTGPALSLFDGLAPMFVYFGIICSPWLVLVVGGVMAARAGRHHGAARVTVWWILAVGAAVLSVPATGRMGTAGIGDDLAAFVLFLVPAVSTCMWLGPAAVVGGLTLARRRKAAGADAAPLADAAPPAEVIAT